jgi:hypothetical protein
MLAAVLVLLTLTNSPAIRTKDANFTACKKETSAQCLTGLGVELAMGARSLPPYMREVGMLAQMGRIEDASALELRILSGKDRPPKNVEAAVNGRLASHRITEAIRHGESLQTAMDATPALKPGALWISALDLLGRSPYGASATPKVKPNDQTRSIVSNIADTIAILAENETERSRTSHLIYAAELQVALGNRDGAIQFLEALPRTENPLIFPTEDLVRLVGSQTVLRLYREAGGALPNILLTAAAAEPELALATEYLERAFSEFSSKDPWPDFSWMERTVNQAASLGLDELSLRLARELAIQTQTEPSAFPVFPHLNAARALMAAGASETEILETLVLAESFFPRDDSEIVGVGVVSGAIVWGGSGLDAQARREIANLRARLGDVGAAIQMMDGIDEPVFAWNDMLTSDIPLEHLEALLEAASDILSKEEHAYIRAQHAQELLFFGGTENQRSWALKTATDLLQGQQLNGDRAANIYSSLGRVGRKLNDPSIESLALINMAHVALNSRSFRDLIRAGFQWHQSDLLP